MALPTVLTGSTYCQEEKAKGKRVSPFLHRGLQLCWHPVHSQRYGFAAGPLPFLRCVLSMKVPHLHPLLWPVLVDLSFLVRGCEAVCPSKTTALLASLAEVSLAHVQESLRGKGQRHAPVSAWGAATSCEKLIVA